jgi:hypothetical protein
MYSNYNGDYLEGFLITAKTYMKLSKKYTYGFHLRLYQPKDIQAMSSQIDSALQILEEKRRYHYATAKKYLKDSTDYVEILDKFFATDDILHDDALNEFIFIDWTTNFSAISDKVSKHLSLKKSLETLSDYRIVVCILNIDAWDGLYNDELAKCIYKVLRLITKEVRKSNYMGFLILDAEDLI